MSARRDKLRETRKRRLMALFAGSAAALAMLSVPIPLIEVVVASTGLSEAIPAAAPPLGFTARAIMAGFAGILSISVSLALSPRGRSKHRHEAAPAAKGEGKMGFALSKLTGLARGRSRAKDGGDAVEAVPVLRRADAHPDAPPRRPIFASQDFDAEIFTRPSVSVVVEDKPAAVVSEVSTALDDLAESFEFAPVDDLAMPHSPVPMDERALLVEAIEKLPDEAAEEQTPTAPLDNLSITELVDRFERGIARRKMLVQAAAAAQKIDDVLIQTGRPPVSEARVLADIPPAPRVDVREGVDSQVDEALRAALGTLHQMTSR